MDNATKQVLIKRLKSLVWRIGGVVGAIVIGWIGENLGLFDLPLWLVGFIGLILNEITKYLNVNVPQLKALRGKTNDIRTA